MHTEIKLRTGESKYIREKKKMIMTKTNVKTTEVDIKIDIKGVSTVELHF